MVQVKEFSPALLERIRLEVDFEAVRSRGPGGQNVNKVSSAALLSWNYLGSSALDWQQKSAVTQKLAAFINKEAQLYLRSDEFRDLPQNKERCLEKLGELLTRACHTPKTRRASKPTRSSQRKHKEAKVQRSKVKKARQKPTY